MTITEYREWLELHIKATTKDVNETKSDIAMCLLDTYKMCLSKLSEVTEPAKQESLEDGLLQAIDNTIEKYCKACFICDRVKEILSRRPSATSKGKDKGGRE